MALINCIECQKEVSSMAAACPSCGHPILTHPPEHKTVAVGPVVNEKPSNGIAAVLSLFIPGAGQMYKGQVGGGILWLLFVIVGYFAWIVPGLILHLFCIVNASTASKGAALAKEHPHAAPADVVEGNEY